MIWNAHLTVLTARKGFSMGWIHSAFTTEGMRRDQRIARSVAKKLRSMGIDARSWETYDAGKTRLHPANLKCGQRLVMVRSIGHALTPTERDYLGDSFLQLGAADLEALIQWLQQ